MLNLWIREKSLNKEDHGENNIQFVTTINMVDRNLQSTLGACNVQKEKGLETLRKWQIHKRYCLERALLLSSSNILTKQWLFPLDIAIVNVSLPSN